MNVIRRITNKHSDSDDDPTLTLDLSTANLLLHAFVWAPIHLYGKNVENSYFGHLLYNSVKSKLDDVCNLTWFAH